jgi:hypothetical protein
MGSRRAAAGHVARVCRAGRFTHSLPAGGFAYTGPAVSLRVALSGWIGVALLAGLAAAARAADDVGGDVASATLACEAVDRPGRVRCTVEATARAGDAITWGDVVLVSVPPFVSILRGRVGPHDSTARTARSWRWTFAVAISRPGHAAIQGRVRLVTCHEGACRPQELPVTGDVAVSQ